MENEAMERETPEDRNVEQRQQHPRGLVYENVAIDQFQGAAAALPQYDDGYDDGILDDAPAFINPDEVVEVEVDDDDVPMDDDDDDGTTHDDVGAEAVVPDMSLVKIPSHAGPVYAVAVACCTSSTTSSSQRSLVVVSGGGDDRAFLHRIESVSGTPPAVHSHFLKHPHTDSVSSVALNLQYVSDDLSKTPRMAAVGSYDGAIVLYDPDTASKRFQLEGPTDVECLAFHPKGGSVLLAGSAADGTLWMYHLVLKKCLQVFVGHQSAVTACDFTADGKQVLSASSDGTVRLWAPRTGNCKHVFHFSQHNPDGAAPGLTCMAIGGGTDAQLVMVGAEDGQAHVCHTGSQKVVASLRHYELPPSHSNAMMGDDDEMLELPRSVEAVGFCPSQPAWCATGGVDGVLKVWDLNVSNGQCRHVCRISGDGGGTGTSSSGGITRLAWHPTLPVVFASTTNGSVHVWDARSGRPLQTITGGSADVVNDMAVHFVSTDGGNGSHQKAIVVTGSDDHSVRVYEVDVMALLSSTVAGPTPVAAIN